MKKSFIFYTVYADKFHSLSDEQFGKLVRCMVKYEATDEVIRSGDAVVDLSFDVVKTDLDLNREKYENIVKRNQENGKKGGRPKTQINPNKPKKPSGLSGNPKNPDKPKKAVYEYEYEYDNDNDNGYENDKDKKENKQRKRKLTVAESRIGKKQFADEVYLTEDEYMKLVRQYGQSGVSRMIDILDNYKVAKQAVYYSDYRAILNWVVNRYMEEVATQQRQQPQSLAEKWGVKVNDDG